jgi:hypothetical protein
MNLKQQQWREKREKKEPGVGKTEGETEPMEGGNPGVCHGFCHQGFIQEVFMKELHSGSSRTFQRLEDVGQGRGRPGRKC